MLQNKKSHLFALSFCLLASACTRAPETPYKTVEFIPQKRPTVKVIWRAPHDGLVHAKNGIFLSYDEYLKAKKRLKQELGIGETVLKEKAQVIGIYNKGEVYLSKKISDEKIWAYFNQGPNSRAELERTPALADRQD